MPETDQTKPSFSSGRRWVFRLNFLLGLLAIAALLVMANYLASGYYKRFQLDGLGSNRLAPLTVRTLEQITNQVEITVFFNPDNELYSMTTALLSEYKYANPKHISIRLLDYTRFNGEATKLLSRLNITGLADRDFVLFECNGQRKICNAKNLSTGWNMNDITQGQPVRHSGFRGELLFTSAIYSVINPQSTRVYFLKGHGERDPSATDDDGYSKLAGVLTNELNADLKGLRIQGTNGVPADCQLLIVAGPRLGHLLPEESEKIETYLQTGGRMFLLLDNSYTNSGAEALLSRWGVEALNDQVNELNDKFVFKGIGFSEAVFCRHPIIDPIQTEAIVFNQPRPFVVKEKKTALGEPSVMLLAASSDKSALAHGTNQAGVYTNLLIAIEKDVIKGVRPGGTRILALGDASLLANNRIDLLANGVFAGLALNWLLERPDILMSNLPARPIPDYKLMLSTTQFARLELFFLVGLPGLIFLVGSMVWLRRRH